MRRRFGIVIYGGPSRSRSEALNIALDMDGSVWVGPGDQRMYRAATDANMFVVVNDEDVVHLVHNDESPKQISTLAHQPRRYEACVLILIIRH
jgi:hypothetical protein